MPLGESVTGTTLEVALEMLRLFQRFERGVESDFPRGEFCGVSGTSSVVVGESLPQVGGVSGVSLVRMTDAREDVCVKHGGPPSIAWNRRVGQPSFAKATEGTICHLEPEGGSKRRMMESAGNAPTWACLQSRCIACLPRPLEIGRLPPCRPEWAEIWRLGRVLTRSLRRIGAVAGSCTRSCVVAGRHL